MANEMVLASDVNVDELKRLGTMLAMSGYFDTPREQNIAVAQMCVKVMAGRELGFGPFASVNGIHVIKGKPAVSANLMAAAVKANPRYDYRVRQMDNEAARIEFFEIVDGKRESLGISEFTRADAKAAGTQNMDKFGRNMMFARAMSNGVKWYAPDVFNGSMVYVPEELGASVDGDGNVIDVDYRSVDKATGEVLSTTTQEAATNGDAEQHVVHVVMQAPAPKENGNGKSGNGKPDAAMFKRYNEAKEAARKSGKFNGNKHLDNAWTKLFKEMNASDTANGDAFLAAWAEYVANHEVSDDDSVPAEVMQDAPEMAF